MVSNRSSVTLRSLSECIVDGDVNPKIHSLYYLNHIHTPNTGRYSTWFTPTLSDTVVYHISDFDIRPVKILFQMWKLKALVVGASIAGPMTAYWLAKAGATVTVIERFSALRLGGQAVDIRTF